MSYLAYRERYVAFLDVLGFSEIISKLTQQSPELDFVYFALNMPQHAKIGMDVRCEDFHITSFSDNVVVSTPVSATGLHTIINYCLQFNYLMLRQGYLTRGAVVRGLLHHNDRAVFGAGLVKAYGIESSIANYARIIVEKNVAGDLSNYKEDDDTLPCKEVIIRDDDGPFFINTLSPIANNKSSWSLQKPGDIEDIITEDDDEMYRMTERAIVHEIISKALERATDFPARYKKVMWLARKFNKYCGSAAINIDVSDAPTW